MPSHLILRCQSEDVVYWEEAKKTPHSRMPDSGSRTVCRHYLRGLCMKGGVRGIFQYFPQMVARWLKAQVSSDSGYQLWGTMFCLPINHSGLANFDSHPLILVKESLELLLTCKSWPHFLVVGLHEKSMLHLLQARPRFHPHPGHPHVCPAFSRVETGDKCEYLHQFDPNRMPECTTFLKVMTRPRVFAMDFLLGILGIFNMKITGGGL